MASVQKYAIAENDAKMLIPVLFCMWWSADIDIILLGKDQCLIVESLVATHNPK